MKNLKFYLQRFAATTVTPTIALKDGSTITVTYASNLEDEVYFSSTSFIYNSNNNSFNSTYSWDSASIENNNIVIRLEDGYDGYDTVTLDTANNKWIFSPSPNNPSYNHSFNFNDTPISYDANNTFSSNFSDILYGYTITIDGNTYPVEFDSTGNLTKVNGTELVDGKVILDGTEYNFSGTKDSITYSEAVTDDPVCKIGNTTYTSITDAVAAAKSGDTIQMLADVSGESSAIQISKEITLDLNGKTISTSIDLSSRLFDINSSGKLTVTDNATGGTISANTTIGNSGGTVEIKGGTFSVGNDFIINSGGTVEISGGTITGKDSDKDEIIFNSNGTITITGGTFSGSDSDNVGIFYNNSLGTISISGGTFNKDVSEFLDEGYELNDNGDGTWTVNQSVTDEQGLNINNDTANSLISGTAYADTINNSGDNVTIDAKASDDMISNTADSVSIYGGDGNDTIIDNGQNTTIDGGAGNDSIALTNDTMNAYAKQVIIASEGNDTVSGVSDKITFNGTFTNSALDGNNVILTTDGGTLTIIDGKDKTLNINSDKQLVNGEIVDAPENTTIGAAFAEFMLKKTEKGYPALGDTEMLDPDTVGSAAPSAYLTENWTIESEDGLKLSGVHYAPENPKGQWIVLVTGYGQVGATLNLPAAVLLGGDYDVLVIDPRTSGSSEGDWLTMGVAESVDLALWTQKIAETNSNAQITLFGVSMGAATVIMAAALSQTTNVTSIIEDCGYANVYSVFEKVANLYAADFGWTGTNEELFEKVTEATKTLTGYNVADAVALNSVPNVTVPSLFIHGTADTLVAVEDVQALYDASGASDKELFKVEGAGHAQSIIESPFEYVGKAINLLQKVNKEIGANIDSSASDTKILGTIYDDTIKATADNVTIESGAGNDSITAIDADKILINAGAGNDYIAPFYANDSSILGGEGNDTIVNNGANTTIDGGAGNDYIELTNDSNNNYESQVIIASAGNDTIKGYDISSVIRGDFTSNELDVNDVIFTNGENTVRIIDGKGKIIKLVDSNGKSNSTIIGGEGSMAIEKVYLDGESLVKDGVKYTALDGDAELKINDSGVVEGIVNGKVIATIDGETDTPEITIDGATAFDFTATGSQDEGLKVNIGENSIAYSAGKATYNADTISYPEGELKLKLTNPASATLFGDVTITVPEVGIEVPNGSDGNNIFGSFLKKDVTISLSGGIVKGSLSAIGEIAYDTDKKVISLAKDATIKGENIGIGDSVTNFEIAALNDTTIVIEGEGTTAEILIKDGSSVHVSGETFGMNADITPTGGDFAFSFLNLLLKDGIGIFTIAKNSTITIKPEDSEAISITADEDDGTAMAKLNDNKILVSTINKKGVTITVGDNTDETLNVFGNVIIDPANSEFIIKKGSIVNTVYDGNFKLEEAGTYTLNGNKITTTEDNVEISLTDDDSFEFDLGAAIEIEGHEITGVEGTKVKVSNGSEDIALVMYKKGTATLDGQTFELTEDDLVDGVTVETIDNGFRVSDVLTAENLEILKALYGEVIQEVFGKFIDKNITDEVIITGDNDGYKVQVSPEGIEKVTGLSDNATIKAFGTFGDEKIPTYIDFVTDTSGTFNLGKNSYKVKDDSEVTFTLEFDENGNGIVLEVNDLEGSFEGKADKKIEINGNKIELAKGSDKFSATAAGDDVTVSGFSNGEKINFDSENVAVEMTSKILTVNGVTYELSDDSDGIIIDGDEIMGLDEKAKLTISKAGNYTVNETPLEVNAGNVILGVSANKAKIYEEINEDSTTDKILQSLEIADDKQQTVGGDEYEEVALPNSIHNAVIVDESTTGEKKITLGDRGSAAIVEETDAIVSIKGGAGKDTLISKGGDVTFDASKGGKDQFIVLDGKVTINGYDPDTKSGVKLTNEQLASDIEFGRGELTIGSEGKSVVVGTNVDNFVNLYTPDNEEKKIGFVSNASKVADASASTGNMLLLGGGEFENMSLAEDVEGATLLGGEGNDTIFGGKGSYIDGGAGKNYVSLSDEGGSTINYAEGRTSLDNFNFVGGDSVADTLQTGELAITEVKVSGDDVILKTNKGRIELKDAEGQTFAFKSDYTTDVIDFNVADTEVNVADNGFYWVAGKDAEVSLTADYKADNGAIIDINDANFNNKDGLSFFGDIKDVDASSFDGKSTITANDKANVITASDGGSTMYGGAGNDTFTGGAGADEFVIGSGKNYISKFGTDDTLNAEFAAVQSVSVDGDAVLFKTNNGSVKVDDIKGQAIQFTSQYINSDDNGNTINFIADDTELDVKVNGLYWAAGNNATVKLENYNNTESVVANLADYNFNNKDGLSFYGNIKELDATGYTGDATLSGNTGNNVITGGSGTNELWGGEGGNDTLIGGDGADTFIYSAGNGNDVIQNVGSNDSINLNGLTLDNIMNVDATDTAIKLNFIDGGSLKVETDNAESVSFATANGTYNYNKETGEWNSQA